MAAAWERPRPTAPSVIAIEALVWPFQRSHHNKANSKAAKGNPFTYLFLRVRGEPSTSPPTRILSRQHCEPQRCQNQPNCDNRKSPLMKTNWKQRYWRSCGNVPHYKHSEGLPRRSSLSCATQEDEFPQPLQRELVGYVMQEWWKRKKVEISLGIYHQLCHSFPPPLTQSPNSNFGQKCRINDCEPCPPHASPDSRQTTIYQTHRDGNRATLTVGFRVLPGFSFSVSV